MRPIESTPKSFLAQAPSRAKPTTYNLKVKKDTWGHPPHRHSKLRTGASHWTEVREQPPKKPGSITKQAGNRLAIVLRRGR